MIYIEELKDDNGLSFVSGDDLADMRIFFNVCKSIGVLTSDPSNSPNIIIGYGESKRAIDFLKSIDFNNVKFVKKFNNNCWSESVIKKYNTTLIDWIKIEG